MIEPINISVCDFPISFQNCFDFFALDDSFYIKNPLSVQTDMNFFISVGLESLFPNNVLYRDNGLVWFKQESRTGIAIYNKEDRLHALMYANSDWENFEIFLSTKKNAGATIKTLSEIAFRNRLLFLGGLVFHASAICCQNAGIAFTAPSGGGKTTQAKLWEAYFDATILNADRPAMMIKNQTPYVFGTPWSGSSKENVNTSAPLKMIAVIEKSNENKLLPLTAKEAVPLLLPRIFLPYFDEKLMELSLSNLDTLLKYVPVCLLKCRPDQKAAELVKSVIL